VALNKLEHLQGLLRSYGSCLVAYSGGVDSVFLAFVAREVLGDKCLAALADSPSLPRRELDEAVAVAARFSIPLQIIRTAEFENPDYLSNPNNRCYFCKHELFSQLTPLARDRHFAVIAYGENASDIGDHRPGAVAAGQFQVRAPLKEAGLTKSEIRAYSAQFGLPTADKPQMPCLSSRVPYGEPVTPEKLRMIEEAEYVLRDLGFRDVRVRHHEGPSGNRGAALARIEIGPEEMPKFLADETLVRVAEALRKIGYAHVTLDLQGYRRGSLNDSPRPAPNPNPNPNPFS
jgi:pyridinium-3,5-biscarboxylic acid mononucleotide sulfurtransferase